MLELKNGCGFIRDLIKSFFSPVGGGRTSFASQNGNIQRKEDLRQEYNYSSSNSDFNRKRGEEYLISSSFASENIVGGGQLRSNNYSASSRSIKGGEGNYTSLMSSDFAGTETMLNPDHIVGGGEIHWKRQLLECKQSLCSWIRLQRKDATKVASQKGGKPFSRTLRSNIRRLVPQEFGRELYANVLASYTRNENDLQKGGNGYLVTPSFLYEGGVC